MNIRENFNQMMHSRNFKNGILYTVFSFVNNGISFILLLILARYLMPSDYGALNLFTTFVTLLNIIISLSTIAYVEVSFFQKTREMLRQVIVICLGTATILLIVLSGIIFLFPQFIEKIIGINISYLWIGVLICYFQVYNALNLDIWRLEEKPLYYGIYSLSSALCNFTLSILLVATFCQGWQGRVNAWFVSSIVYFLISIVFLIRRKYLRITCPSFSLIKETFVYALPLIPHTAAFWFKQGLDRYIINYFHDQSAVGYFSFAMNMAAIIVMVGAAFNSTNTVYIYKKLAAGYDTARVTLSRQIKIMSFVFIGVFIGVLLFATILICYFLPNYSGSLIYLFPLCLGAFFQCVYLLWVNYLFYYKKTKQLMHRTVATAFIQVVLSVWLTRYSPLFTAYISMCVSALTCLLVYIETKRVLKTQLILESEIN